MYIHSANYTINNRGQRFLCLAEVGELLYEVMACGRKDFLYLYQRS